MGTPLLALAVRASDIWAMTDDLTATINAALARAPEWVRSDMVSGEPSARRRAEDALAAMIAAALRQKDIGTG